MKHLDEYRNPLLARRLIQKIRDRANRPWVLMDVCGGQTHSLVRSGIEMKLSGVVELIHGPGCPVCVTPVDVIDFAVALSMEPDTIVASFGDMMRVPGSTHSLIDARRQGGQVQIVYSPVDAVRLAEQHTNKNVVFLAVGFETTAPSTALALLQAAKLGLTNFSIVPAHVRVQPAMELLMNSPDNRVEGFLAAGHVCTVTGFWSYQSFVQKYHVPVIVTGFEPIDLLEGILECVSCLEQDEPKVVNRYGRNVNEVGNESAQELIDRVYQASDRSWRGFGVIPGGGLDLRPKWADHNAFIKFRHAIPASGHENEQCRGADVMSGKIKPKQCPAFAESCTPESPLGAPMVSSEGACAAYYRFQPISISLPQEST